MAEWVEIRASVWEMPVRVGSHEAVARVEHERRHGTWVTRILWDDTVHGQIGGYPNAALARYHVGDAVVAACPRA
jgi:hypothetical protein